MCVIVPYVNVCMYSDLSMKRLRPAQEFQKESQEAAPATLTKHWEMSRQACYTMVRHLHPQQLTLIRIISSAFHESESCLVMAQSQLVFNHFITLGQHPTHRSQSLTEIANFAEKTSPVCAGTL